MSAQSVTALRRATQIRSEGESYRRTLAALDYAEGRRAAAELLEDPPEAVARMRVGRFVLAIRRVGERQAYALLRQAGITAGCWDRRIGPVELPDAQLTERQRFELALVLRGP